jgi:hypothetical protein
MRAGSATPTMQDAATAAVEAKGAGVPVDTSIATKVGAHLGADFSGVRVHHDSVAHEASDAMGARAFAHGSDNAANFAPGSGAAHDAAFHAGIAARSGPANGTSRARMRSGSSTISRHFASSSKLGTDGSSAMDQRVSGRHRMRWFAVNRALG